MFNPPTGVTSGAEYRYGNVVWVFDGTGDVWNIRDGTIIGAAGPAGAQGVTGPTGNTGGGTTGDNGSLLFNESSGRITIRHGSYTLTGIASYDPRFFGIGVTGHLTLTGTYQVTGPTIVSGGSSQLLSTSNNTVTIDNRLASAAGATGVASFRNTHFLVDGTGHVQLAAAYQVTGDTVITVANSGIAISTVGNTDTLYNIGVLSLNGITGPIGITGVRHGVAFFAPAITASGLSANNTFLFDGRALTFGTTDSRFTVTGPSMIIGAATEVTGGVFKNPTESAPFFNLVNDNNTLVVNGASGSIQRFSVNPNARMTITTGTSWHAFTAATETIAVIVENRGGFTAAFDASILVDGDKPPSLFGKNTVANRGVTGGISVFTIMRVNKGSNKGLTMGFVISTGMTGAGVSINN